MRVFVALPLILALIAGCATTKPTADASKPESEQSKPNGDDKEAIKAFKDVIKDDFESDEGLFTVYKDKTTYYYEIPDERLGEEFLLVTRIAKSADNVGYGGTKQNTQTVRWVRQGDKIHLRVSGYQNVADEDEPIYQAVQNSNLEPILKAFDIKAYNKDTTGVVIDVTSLYTEDIPALGLPARSRTTYKVRRLDGSRSYIESIKSYPKNIEARHILTYEATEAPSNASTNTITLLMNQSMIALPEVPMRTRECDKRVGFFSMSVTKYAEDQQKAETDCFITRWRLEPSDKAAYARGELVEPVKQIVYYIDPATPEKWRPFLKQGVDDWNSAFEKAGFKNAIRGAYPPTMEEDPEFSPEDVRYSVIRYYASDIQNAFGPHVSDPRTGEILESDIGWYHNVMNLLRNWYMIQTAAANPEARGVEFEDDVMGELVRFVSAHEVGHTLGFPHAWGSSAAYPVDSLRSPTFTATHGTAPSIMDYARFNYIAQPEDGVTSFGAKIGEYDDWVAKWGYTWMDDKTVEDEKSTLNDWTVERADDPLYFYGRQGPRVDPRSQNEDLGDNAMYASDLGIKNLKRILDQLVTWTAEDGKDYDDLQELYNNVRGQYNRYVGHVGANVGGLFETFKTYDQDGAVYEAIPKAHQQEAMQWLVENVYNTPTWLIDTNVIRRFQGVGTVDAIRGYQVGSVNYLLDPQRMARMMEFETVDGDTYTVSDMLNDLRGGIFTELSNAEAIDAYRRNLQRGYVERLQYLMENEGTPPPAFFMSYGYSRIDVSQSDIRAYVRGELETLQAQTDRAASRTRDNMTRLHLRDLSVRIADILDTDDQ